MDETSKAPRDSAPFELVQNQGPRNGTIGPSAFRPTSDSSSPVSFVSFQQYILGSSTFSLCILPTTFFLDC